MRANSNVLAALRFAFCKRIESGQFCLFLTQKSAKRLSLPFVRFLSQLLSKVLDIEPGHHPVHDGHRKLGFT